MKKYNIEGGIDFFNELYKSLDETENNNKTEEDNNLCLITDKPLQDNFVSLDCGHKFNYIPLYLDIKNHKQKFNNLEGHSTRLNTNEIRCPYCRKIHKSVLEYYPELGLPKVNGVNYIDPKYKEPTGYYNYPSKLCQFLTPNPSFDTSSNEESNSNSKFLKCYCYGNQICYTDKKDLLNVSFGDEKYYCWNHRTEMIRKYKKEYYDKKKAEQIQAKMLVKQELKKAKEDEKEAKKQLKKLEKMAKELKKSVINTKLNKIPENNEELNENNVIGTIYIIEGDLCPIILKSGTNKGNKCGNKIIENGCCKRHCKPVKKEEST